MSYNLLRFRDFNELLEYIDTTIDNLMKKYNELYQRLNVLRARAERIKKFEEALSKLMGEEITSINEIDFMGLKVVISARSVDELAVVEEVVNSLQDTITALKKVREVISELAKAVSQEGEVEGLSILVETINGIPVRLLLKEGE